MTSQSAQKPDWEKEFDKKYGKNLLYTGSLKTLKEQQSIMVPQNEWIKTFIHTVVDEARRQERERVIEEATFDDLVNITQRILDLHYPEKVFKGKVKDTGVRFVVALRQFLAFMREQGK